MFLTATCGALGYSFGGLASSELIPTRAIIGLPGLKAYGYRAGLWFFVPALVGYYIGESMFGDYEHLSQLQSHKRQYKKEFKKYQQDEYA